MSAEVREEFPRIEVEDILRQSKDQIIEAIKHRVTERLVYTVSQQVELQIGVIVSEFIKTEIAPQALVQLQASREQILFDLASGLGEVGAKVAESLLKKAIDNMTKSWNVDKLSEALFR